jgi:hypothetical protein
MFFVQHTRSFAKAQSGMCGALDGGGGVHGGKAMNMRGGEWRKRLRRWWRTLLRYVLFPALAALLALFVWSVLSG